MLYCAYGYIRILVINLNNGNGLKGDSTRRSRADSHQKSLVRGSGKGPHIRNVHECVGHPPVVWGTRRVPRFVVEYIMFHEMLHLKHPVKLRGSRRCVHSREFAAEERSFPELAQAQRFLKHI